MCAQRNQADTPEAPRTSDAPASFPSTDPERAGTAAAALESRPADTLAERITGAALRIAPRNHLSSLFGTFAKTPLPRALRGPLYRWYAARYGARLDEAELPLEAYPSLSAFFVRNLVPGARPIGPGIVSPVDGKISEWGTIHAERMIQAKGLDYTVSELLLGIGGRRIAGADELSRRFHGGTFITFYLAPGDYHQIHAPVAGTIAATAIHPGTLWPVNSWSVRTIPSLFAINERVVTFLETPHGAVAVVMVGATNVGSITVSYAPFRTNVGIWMGGERTSTLIRPAAGQPPVTVEKGETLGAFNLGSTVILLCEPGTLIAKEGLARGAVRYGESIGTFGR